MDPTEDGGALLACEAEGGVADGDDSEAWLSSADATHLRQSAVLIFSFASIRVPIRGRGCSWGRVEQ
jgi:hypothetical protein